MTEQRAPQYMNISKPYYDPTCGPEDAIRIVVSNGRIRWIHDIEHWSGLDEHSCYLQLSFRYTDCYALVYAANSIASFNNIHEWKKLLDCLSERPMSPLAEPSNSPRKLCIPGALVETKCDLKDEREVSVGDGVQLARELGCSFLQTSLPAQHNFDRVFEVMGQAYIDASRFDGRCTARQAEISPLSALPPLPVIPAIIWPHDE